jgi:hypothetical protein
MRQLARTLLILGSVTACERAHPDCDPAQTRLATPSRLATPLVDVNGAPAVGNIGQTGAPAANSEGVRTTNVGVRAADITARTADIGAFERTRRAQRVVRAATMPRPASNPGSMGPVLRPDDLSGELAPPDMRPDVRPDIPARVPPSRTTRLEFQREDSAQFSLTQERPLVNRRERPAHANMGRRAYIPERDE